MKQGRPKNPGLDVAEFRRTLDLVSKYEVPDEFMLRLLKSLPCEPPNKYPSEWAEQERYIPKGASPFEGAFKFERAPYWREVVDRFHPLDPCQGVAVMKGTQVMFTGSVLETVIGYGMACNPTNMLFVSGDEKLLSKMKKTRIDPMIDASGLREKVRPDTLKKGIKRTGDSGGLIEFSGGMLSLCGPNNESNFQGMSYQYLLLDEVDLYPYKLGRSGETVSVIEGRSDAYGDRQKVLYGSRPTVAFGISDTEKEDGDEEVANKKVRADEVGSRILELYKQGDQRKYMVPCPHCGEMQALEFFKGTTDKGVEYGLHFDKVACLDGDYNSVAYQCRGCGGKIEEYHKAQMLQESTGAHWEPTAKAKVPYFYSYQVSALYSLAKPWWHIVKEFLLAKGDPHAMQLFYNKNLGLPFEDRSGGVQLSALNERIGNYLKNSLPPIAKKDILFLTAAADIQTGTKNPRIEVEVKAWGRDFRNWSIDYRIFKGDVTNIEDKCWKSLAAMLDEKWGSQELMLERMGVDSSDGNMTSTVYDACRKYGQGDAVLMVPLKGLKTVARTRVRQIVKELQNERFPLVEVCSDLYKNQVAMWLRKEWRPGEAIPVGWAQFPVGYEKEYYRQLQTEERVKKREGRQTIITWVQHGRNESWDIFCYNAAMCDFVLEDYSCQVLNLDKGNAKAVWDYFENIRA